jgi:hypothetical protein
MQGMERAYDFQELVGCANTVNQLAAIEYGPNEPQFGRAHTKQCNIWADLHPLEQGESLADLGDYSALATYEDFVSALKEGLKAAHAQLKVLNMAPSSYARNKLWFLQPWMVERADPKHWAYVAPEKPIPGENGDGEVMRDSEIMPPEEETVDGDGANIHSDMSVVDIDVDMSIVNASLDDSEEILRLAKEECRDAISQMLD